MCLMFPSMDRYRLLHEYAATFSYQVELSQWPEAMTLDEVLNVDIVKQLDVDLDTPPKWAP